MTDLPHIGLVAPAQSGKDTVGALLGRLAGYTRVAFADAVRESMLAIDPLVCAGARLSDLVDTVGWDNAKRIQEVRRLLQAHGDATRRILGGDAWLRIGMAKAGAAGGPCVFTDVRYRNEAEAIRAAGGVIVRVDRPSRPYAEHSLARHVSETELADYRQDFTVLNDGTLTQLHVKVDRLLELIRDRVPQQMAMPLGGAS